MGLRPRPFYEIQLELSLYLFNTKLDEDKFYNKIVLFKWSARSIISSDKVYTRDDESKYLLQDLRILIYFIFRGNHLRRSPIKMIGSSTGPPLE